MTYTPIHPAPDWTAPEASWEGDSSAGSCTGFQTSQDNSTASVLPKAVYTFYIIYFNEKISFNFILEITP